MKKNILIVSLHALCWVCILIGPLYFIRETAVAFRPDVDGVYPRILINISLLLIAAFYFNYFVLIPKLLFRKKYLLYIISAILLVIVMFALPKLVLMMITSNQVRVDADLNIQKLKPVFLSNVMLLILSVFLASIGLRLNNRWKQTEAERVSAQLAYLKTQVNPHFLFNTLNSIYAVTISKAPQAAAMVEKLSQLMRYTLKQAQQPCVPLQAELDYISAYIDLQKVRFDDSVTFGFHTSGESKSYEITPLLLIPFIENAFKHGVNSEEQSDIQINIAINNGELHLLVSNNKVPIAQSSEEQSGLGINNTKHRLQLIYPGRHLLAITDTDGHFNVSLHIHLQ